MARSTYAIALGSNRRTRFGSPRRTVRAALAVLQPGIASRVTETQPIGPSRRRYANAVALIESARAPPAFLATLKAIERDFGRRSGRRWGDRALDLDIVLWSEGSWESPGLIVPHTALRDRAFVLRPLAEIAPAWRDPVTRLTVRQLAARLTRATRMPR